MIIKSAEFIENHSNCDDYENKRNPGNINGNQVHATK
jgi:hypothetical protein